MVKEMPNILAVPKKSLSEEDLETFFDMQKFHQIVLDNIKHTLDGRLSDDCTESILSFPDFEKRFDFDGSIKVNDDPTKTEDTSVADFFSVYGRFENRNGGYDLRGARYVVSLDPNLEVRQKLAILRDDFMDGLLAISNNEETKNVSNDEFLERCAVLDYIKNSTTTLLNALIYREKVGDFKMVDTEYQEARLKAIKVAQYATKLFYSYLIGRRNDYRETLKMLAEIRNDIDFLVSHLENQYIFGAFSSRSFVRPEASHPLVVASASYNIASKIQDADTIIGMPSGGTELAFAVQCAYEFLSGKKPNVVLLPLSIHSIKNFTELDGASPENAEDVSDYLTANTSVINGKCIVIVDDNSSTGQTMQKAVDLIINKTEP